MSGGGKKESGADQVGPDEKSRKMKNTESEAKQAAVFKTDGKSGGGPKIKIFADATADLPSEFIEKHEIGIIGLRYQIGREDGVFTFSRDSAILDNFYDRMRKGESASTSLVLYDDAAEAFEPFFRDGFDIIHFGLASGLAKTWENAAKAGADLAKKYGRKFYAPDTRCVSAMNLLIIERLLELISGSGGDLFEIIEAELPKFYGKVRAFFTVENLKYLHKSGRLSTAAKLIGGILDVKPIVTVDADGKLAQFTKKIGRAQSLAFLAQQAVLAAVNTEFLIIHADCAADVKILEAKIRSICPAAQIRVITMGFIIGCHTGPGTIGIGFLGK
jgi:DegV family protein with EDD domain